MIKEIVAFANTQGSTILVDIEDGGAVCGAENADRVITC